MNSTRIRRWRPLGPDATSGFRLESSACTESTAHNIRIGKAMIAQATGWTPESHQRQSPEGLDNDGAGWAI